MSFAPHPRRLAHLATRPIVVSRLAPMFAHIHEIDDEEAAQRLTRALAGNLLSELLDAAWAGLVELKKAKDDEALLEKLAKALAKHPYRHGRVIEPDAAWSAFLLRIDLEAGMAGQAAQRMMDAPEGKKMAAAGLATAGRYLAAELIR